MRLLVVLFPFVPVYAHTPTAAEKAKRPLRLTYQNSSTSSTLASQRDRSCSKGAKVALDTGANCRKSKGDSGAMHNEIGIDEQRA